MTHVEDVVLAPHQHDHVDCDKLTLVLAARAANRGNEPSFAPQGTVVDNDSVLRKYYLMSRSVIAAAFDHGELGARHVEIGPLDCPIEMLIVGQREVLPDAVGDMLTLMDRTPGWTGADLVVPVSRFDGGWRTQPAWVAIKQSVDGDDRALYNWVRPSFRWLRTARADGSTPGKAIVTARRLLQHPVKSMAAIFAEAQDYAS